MKFNSITSEFAEALAAIVGREHVLLPGASALHDADASAVARLTPAAIRDIVALVPDGWLPHDGAEAERRAYAAYLIARVQGPRSFVEEAIRARLPRV